MSTITKSLFLAFSFFPLCLSCSCTEDSFGKSRFEVICDAYANSNNIYVARVEAAYCKCQTPLSSNQFSCIEFKQEGGGDGPIFRKRTLISGTGRVVGSVNGTYECQDFQSSQLNEYYQNCSTVITRVGITNVTESAELLDDAATTPVRNITQCKDVPHKDELSKGCAITIQPCYYTVSIENIYKGTDYQLGERFNTSGPHVLFPCTNKDRILTVGESYVVGIGGFCDVIADWSGVNDYSYTEFDILVNLRDNGRSTECPGTGGLTGLTGAQVAIVTVVVILYTVVVVAIIMIATVLSLKCEDKKKGKQLQEVITDEDEPKDTSQNLDEERDDATSPEEKGLLTDKSSIV